MPLKHFLLTDQATSINEVECAIGPDEVGGPARGYRVRKQRLESGRSAGVETVDVDNGLFRFRLLPTRGMGVWKAWLGEIELGWRSPVRGPTHPAFVPVEAPNGLGFLEGFDELLTRCGLVSNGAPDFDPRGKLLYPLHGRVANLPAHRLEASVDGDSGEIRLTGEVSETRFLCHNLRLRSAIVTRVGQPGFSIEDEVTNESALPMEIQLLYHINVGLPFLESGARLVAPIQELAPRDARAAEGMATWDAYAEPQGGFAEQVYFTRLRADADGRSRVLLADRAGQRGLSLAWPVEQLPYFVLWKNTVAEADGYVTGLEPATNLPNVRTFEGAEGRVVKLAPGETTRFSIELRVAATAAEVAAEREAIRRLQGAGEAVVHRRPRPGWTPGAS